MGEGTTLVLPQHLHDYLKIDIGEFYRLAQPQWKLGIRFLWGKRPYFDYTFAHQLDTKYHLLAKTHRLLLQRRLGLRRHSQRPDDAQPHLRARPAGLAGRSTSDVAYHIENEKFVTFLEGYARQLGVAIEDDTVEEVLQDEHGVTGLRMVTRPHR